MNLIASLLVLFATAPAFAKGWTCKNKEGQRTISVVEIPVDPKYVIYIHDPKVCFAVGRSCPYAEVAERIGTFIISKEETRPTGLSFDPNPAGFVLRNVKRESNMIVPTGTPWHFRPGECDRIN